LKYRLDPVILLTTEDDQFLFLHWLNRAIENNIEFQLLINLNRKLDQLFEKQVRIFTELQESIR
jgi:hypothetical protein